MQTTLHICRVEPQHLATQQFITLIGFLQGGTNLRGWGGRPWSSLTEGKKKWPTNVWCTAFSSLLWGLFWEVKKKLGQQRWLVIPTISSLMGMWVLEAGVHSEKKSCFLGVEKSSVLRGLSSNLHRCLISLILEKSNPGSMFVSHSGFWIERIVDGIQWIK